MKISHRYPVNAAGNDIDRAWLVDQLPTAKRPNALLEVALSAMQQMCDSTCRTGALTSAARIHRVASASPAADGSTEPQPYKHRTPEDVQSSGVCYIGGNTNIY